MTSGEAASVPLAAALAAAAVAVAMPSKGGLVRRLHHVLGHAGGPPPTSTGSGAQTADRAASPGPPTAALHRLAIAGVLALAVVALGGLLGLLVGLGAAWVARTVLRTAEPPAVRRLRERLAADVPGVADLLAACLECGASPTHAVRSVADALGSPWDALLLPPLAAVRLGADPRRVWGVLANEATTRPLADVLARGFEDGVALVPLLRALAVDARRERRSAARVRAQRAGVLALGPLGACFLPAFVLVGVVPVVVSVGRDVLGGLT